jgi:hypothetical protein
MEGFIMPNVGDTKTCYHYYTKADIERKIDLNNITSWAVNVTAEGVGAGIGYVVAGALGAAGGAISVELGKQALIAAIKAQNDKLEDLLKMIRDGNGFGIRTKQVCRYSYMSGSGTAWYKASPTEISVY